MYTALYVLYRYSLPSNHTISATFILPLPVLVLRISSTVHTLIIQSSQSGHMCTTTLFKFRLKIQKNTKPLQIFRRIYQTNLFSARHSIFRRFFDRRVGGGSWLFQHDVHLICRSRRVFFVLYNTETHSVLVKRYCRTCH